MRGLRRSLRRLNAARAVAVSTLLVAAFTIELLFAPGRSLRPLYLLSATAFGTILLYALLDRRLGNTRLLARLEVAGDTALVAGFVVASGGALSPVSFLFALPLMTAAALLGLRSGLIAAGAAWCTYALLLTSDLVRLPPGELPVGQALHAAVSHMLGFLSLGALGGALADRLTRTDSALAEHQGDLAALRALHADIVESISTGMLTTDRGGVVTFVNRAGLELLRRPGPETIGRPAAELFGLPGDFLAEAGDHLKSGRRYRFERSWTRSAGEDPVPLGFAVSVLRGPSGSPEGWLVVFQDLTEIASLEEQVRTRERMAALGEMAAGMAHELRNPLAAISGCVQVLGSAGASEEQRTLIDVATTETERLNRIIRDFLQFARPGPFQPRPVDLHGLMQEMAQILRKTPDLGPRHRIDVACGPGTSIALVDPDRIRQVFWNLASNALKAMPDGGRLEIEVSGYGGDRVLLAFRDEGHGMDGETLSRLFQPFHGHFPGGAGLGAAIVYRIVEEHGGQVQVVSRPGRGTELRLMLPAAPRDATAGEGARPAQSEEEEQAGEPVSASAPAKRDVVPVEVAWR
ncbi:MAG: PAS domain-containing protein [Acidobacteria bacterium]|nr:PAS domain-containing protein [Acidobacteriota bacterium]